MGRNRKFTCCQPVSACPSDGRTQADNAPDGARSRPMPMPGKTMPPLPKTLRDYSVLTVVLTRT
jgi:hypothetical protein